MENDIYRILRNSRNQIRNDSGINRSDNYNVNANNNNESNIVINNNSNSQNINNNSNLQDNVITQEIFRFLNSLEDKYKKENINENLVPINGRYDVLNNNDIRGILYYFGQRRETNNNFNIYNGNRINNNTSIFSTLRDYFEIIPLNETFTEVESNFSYPSLNNDESFNSI